MNASRSNMIGIAERPADLVPPNPPTLALSDSSNSGIKSDNKTNDTTPSFTGTAEANSDVELTVSSWTSNEQNDLAYQNVEASNFLALTPTNIGGAISVEAWVKLDAHNTWSRVIDFGNGSGRDNIIVSLYGNTGRLFFETWNGGSRSLRMATDERAPLNLSLIHI